MFPNVGEHPLLASYDEGRKQNVLAHLRGTHGAARSTARLCSLLFLAASGLVWLWLVGYNERHPLFTGSASRDVAAALVFACYWVIAFVSPWFVRRWIVYRALWRALSALPESGFCESCLYPAPDARSARWTCPECGTPNNAMGDDASAPTMAADRQRDPE